MGGIHLTRRDVALLCCALFSTPISRAYSWKSGSAKTVRARVYDRSVRKLESEFFSFNLEWLEFQRGIRGPREKTRTAALIQWMAPFQGAYYRYPGGNNSNYYAWKDAIGSRESRSLEKRISWAPPTRIEFGIKEYFDFVRAVRGKPWYVLNLYGRFGREMQVDELKTEASQLISYLRASQRPFPRLELGNELYMNAAKWPPSKVIARSEDFYRFLLANGASQDAVLPLQEFASWREAGYSMSRFNGELSRAVPLNQFSLHFYYDGPPLAPPVQKQLTTLDTILSDVKRTGRESPIVWITEHARAPVGAWTTPEWLSRFDQTVNIDAAVSVSDMVLGLAQRPSVRGAFLHALHASSGPWAMFRVDPLLEEISPHLTYWAVRLLRETMLAEALATEVAGPNGSDPSFRLVAMASPDRSQSSIWIVNRSEREVIADIELPPLWRAKRVRLFSLSAQSPRINTIDELAEDLPVRDQVNLRVPVRPNSVSAVKINSSI